MTAIGFALIIFSIIMKTINDELYFPDWLETIYILSFFIGIFMLFASVFILLWRFAP
jgi:hypothetical protein